MKVFAVLVVCMVAASFAGCTPPSETFSAVAAPGKPANLVVEPLRAGPVTMKFDNGELRYLETGDGLGRNVENVRRVYFAVRDQRFDTPTPVFDKITVVRNGDSFTAEYSARVRHNNVEFAWTGAIEGKPDGTIVYTVTGQSGRDFASPRIGLNVLLGTSTYGGRTLEFSPLTGGEKSSVVFPKSPAAFDPGRFASFRSTGPVKDRYMHAGFAATLSGREFGIEDQRQFGDSSYKAYGYLDLPFPNVPANAKASQTLTLTFPDAKPAVQQKDTIRVTFEQHNDKAAIPVIRLSHEPARAADFNTARKTKPTATEAAWGFNPALHLNDADMLFENTETIVAQVAAVRAVAPNAKIHINPITFQWPHPRPAPDGRAVGITGAAWCVEMLRQLALAGANEATFQLMDQPWENSPAGDALKVWSRFSGEALKAQSPYADVRYLVNYTTDAPGRCPISVLAVNNTEQVRTVFLVNRSAGPQRVTFVDAVAKQASVAPVQLGRDAWSSPTKQGARNCLAGALCPDGKNVEALVSPYAVIAFTLSNLAQ